MTRANDTEELQETYDVAYERKIAVKWVDAAMEHSCLTITQLADECGVHRDMVSSWKAGRSRPSRVHQNDLYKLAGYEPDRYLNGPG